MSDCGGAFAANYEQDIGGAITAVSQFGGAKPNNPNKPSAGWHGGSVGGHPLKLVGIGCANDTADSAIKETKRLMEQLGADMMIGPLSGDESVAVANYAKQHPTKTFVNGTAGAWDTTAAVKAPNFFRFNGSGVQWQAGIGSIATKKNKWKKAAIIMDDYSFGYASGAGFIADFCAAGGNITKRVFPPLNTTDYSSFVQQLPAPDKVDGYFWAIGGTGTVPSIKAFENLYGTLKASQIIGNLFFFSSGADKAIGPHLSGAYVGGFGTAPDLKGAAVTKYKRILDKWFNKYPPLAGKASDHAADGFTYNYYVNAQALMKALIAVKGNISGGQKALQKRLRVTTLPDAAYGKLRLGKNNQALQQQYSYRMDVSAPGSLAVVTVQKVVQYVDETFGGTVTSRRAGPTRPAPTRGSRGPGRGDPSSTESSSSELVAEAATQPRSAAPALLLRGVGRRFGGLHAVRDVDLQIADGERRAILGLNGAGKTTLFNVISGDFPPSAGTVELFGRDVTHLPARARAKLGLARTYQQARMLLGIERRGQHLPLDRRRRTRPSTASHPARKRPCDTRSCARRRTAGCDRPQAGGYGRVALTRRASSGRARHGSRVGAKDAHAGRARLGAVAWRAAAPDRPSARARPEHHAHPDRARHGHRASGRRAGDDDARRTGDRRRHDRRDTGERTRPRPVPRARQP